MNPTNDINTPQDPQTPPNAPVQLNQQPAPLPPKKSHKKLIIAIIIISSFFFLAALALIGLVASKVYDELSSGGISAITSTQTDGYSPKEVSGPITLSGTTVNLDCFSFTAPTYYELSPHSSDCSTAVNIPKGDSLTYIGVSANIRKNRTVEEALQYLISKAESTGATVQDSGALTLKNGNTGAFVHFRDTYKLLYGMYYIVTPDPHFSVNGKLIYGTLVNGYVYNKDLKAIVEGVVNSVTLK